MTKITKRMASLALAIVLATSMSTVSVSAAGNISDREFVIPLPKYSYMICTGNNWDVKKDATGTYVYFKEGPADGADFMVWGGFMAYDGSGSLPAANLTKDSFARIYPKQQRLIKQYVYEEGYDYAHLCAMSRRAADEGVLISGVWSPDSVGNIAYANP